MRGGEVTLERETRLPIYTNFQVTDLLLGCIFSARIRRVCSLSRGSIVWTLATWLGKLAGERDGQGKRRN